MIQWLKISYLNNLPPAGFAFNDSKVVPTTSSVEDESKIWLGRESWTIQMQTYILEYVI